MRIPAAPLPVAAAAALAVGWRRQRRQRRQRRPDDVSGEVAVVTGASRGLGLLLATELARRGCKLVICARDADELEKAAVRLREAGAEVAAMACDVASEDAAHRLVDAARQHYGRLDIVISNAGTIRVGPVQSTTAADYEEALGVMALAPARLALVALPVMQEQGHGRIVTIASIGGKISVPHLLPYSTAKFAAVGFSEGLRAELGGGPVTVTTVVPGLMRTGSHVRAEFAGQREREFTWFALGASLPLVSMDAKRAARQIVDGVAARRPEVLLTPAGQVAARLAGLVPGLTTAVLHAAGQVTLPGPDGSGEATAGQGLRPAMPAAMFNVLTWLGRAASARFNELSRKPREERV